MAVAETEKSATEQITGDPLTAFVKAGAIEKAKISEAEKAVLESKAKPSAEATGEQAKTPAPETPKSEQAAPKDEAKPEASKTEAKPTPNIEKKDKQIKDTRDALTQERKKNLDLERKLDSVAAKLDVVQQKLDGTYEEKKAPKRTEQDIELEASHKAKIKLSEKAARKQFGDEEIEKKILDKDSPYMVLEREKPWIGMRVGYADEPVVEAMSVLWEEGKFKEHETRDWKVILEKEVQAALAAKRDELVKEATDIMNGKGKKEQAALRGLDKARGVTGLDKEKPPAINPNAFLNRAFGHAPRDSRP